jgi:large subunit ribosomal protein L10
MEKVGKIFRGKLISEVTENVRKNSAVFLLGYSEVSSARMDIFRKDLKRVNAKMFMSKNRLAQLALKTVDRAQLAERISGQTAFIWSNHDAAVLSKLLVKFAKDCNGVQIKGGLLEGALLQKEDVQRLADLPSREVLQSQLLGTILAPLTRFAGILNGKTRDLLSIMKQLSAKKGGN